MKISYKKFGALLIGFLFLGIGFFFFKQKQPQLFEQKLTNINLDSLSGKDNLVPLLILGSGPASLSAALYGARMRIPTVVLKGNQPGGQLSETSYIENWPGIRKIRGTEVMRDLEEQAARFGAAMISDAVIRVDLSQWPYRVDTEEGKTLYALSLMIGTGAEPRKLNVPGEHEYWGKGVTTCAICDAPYHKGSEVVVIGGGDSAVEEAMELSSYARRVRILVRTDKMRASKVMIERLKDCSNVEIVFNTSVTKIVGNGTDVTGVDIYQSDTKTKDHWKITGVFLAIGHDPRTVLFKDQLKLDQTGHIIIQSETRSTSVSGVFSAGDVSDSRYRQAGVAAGDGIKAGLDAIWWLNEIGYNAKLEQELETYLFNKDLDKKVEIRQMNSCTDFDMVEKESGSKLIVLDFFTPYCPSCMHMLPVVESVATRLADKTVFVKVNASKAFDLVKKFMVRSVPCLLIFKDGKEIVRHSEPMNRKELYAFVKKFLE